MKGQRSLLLIVNYLITYLFLFIFIAEDQNPKYTATHAKQAKYFNSFIISTSCCFFTSSDAIKHLELISETLKTFFFEVIMS